MPYRLSISDWLSLSRIPLAIAFTLAFSPDSIINYTIGISIALIALATDFADGYLARRQNTVSSFGYMADGLGDKVFYTAIIVVSIRNNYAGTILAMLLISKEIALYAIRAVDKKLSRRLEDFRPFSRVSALFIRVFFCLFFIWCYLPDSSIYASFIHVAGNASGWLSAVVGLSGTALIARQMWEEATGSPPK